jgi:DNA primase
VAKWIDFKELRQRLPFVDVLKHYSVELKVKGDRASALCPLPNHPERTDGQKRTASFSANLTKGIWQCFGCKCSGNAVEFAIRMEGLDPSDPVAFRKGALQVAEIFGITTERSANNGASASKSPVALPEHNQVASTSPAAVAPSSKPIAAPPTTPPTKVVVNEPLDFELKKLDPKHPYLPGRGFAPETIEHFGLGFCAKGMMAERIAIPLHDGAGKLIGYAGRIVEDTRISDEHPKYRFPGPRDRNGTRYEFHKNAMLYNAHRIEKPVADLIVVEGFASVWWLMQAGYADVVALMGSSCSKEQAHAIIDLVQAGGRVWVFPDGDAAGEQCAQSMLVQLSPHRWTRWVKLTEGAQPTHCTQLNMSFIFEGCRNTLRVSQ